ncbi:MAG: PepSY-associated TM helix domain-containing protein [Cellvibrio sp.]|uniref:PepSY-associated TM helix domain-containing protein n=1 Tax=Cellvibrio sp. TaxID=1965322 RepID=UPI0031AD21BA
MKNGFRQSMAWVHTWGGLSVGWILFFVFLTGTLGYFDTEIDRWMKPELPKDTSTMEQALTVAEARLEQKAVGAERWFISPPTNRDNPNLRIFWQMPGEEGKRGITGNELLDSTTGDALSGRATGGGQTLYRMHYALHYLPTDVAYWIVGICSMFMLVAIITGIVIHKKIFKDFFTFRPQKGQRSWLDIHNLLSVTALPFHFMITYSGLIFFAFTYMPLIVSSSYGTGEDAEQAFFDELFEETDKAERANIHADLASLSAMVAIAQSQWGKDQVRYIDIANPGDANARVSIGRQLDSPLRSSPELVFDGVSGELLSNKAAATSAPRTVRDTFLGLHEGLFANITLRWLYFLSGLLGTAMIATGMILWTVKRRPAQLKQAKGPDVGHRLVESLNLGTIVGLPIAIAAYFWANRLLAVDFAARSEWEVHSMFLVWAGTLIYSFVAWPVVRNITRHWIHLLWLAAAAYSLLPVLNALTTDRHITRSLINGDWLFAAIDLTFLVTGILFAFTAFKLQHRVPQAAPKKRAAPAANQHAIEPDAPTTPQEAV